MNVSVDDGAITDPDAARAYLGTLSSHPFRPGDTSFLHPDFAVKMANAVKQARAQGLPVNVSSGYRAPTTTGSNYDAAGMSLHGYGAAIDVGGIGSAGSPQAQQWAKIAQANGVYNPYGVSNPKEFNHWQLVPWKLENRPDVQKQLIAANGDGSKVWNAVAPVSAQPSNASAYGSTPSGKPSADPFAEYPTQPVAAAKGSASAPDPFSEYPTSKAPVSAAPSAPASASPAPVANGDPFSEYPTTAAASAQPVAPATAALGVPLSPQDRAARMAGAVPGPNGLVWNQNGGFDPQTGELVLGKPVDTGVSQGRSFLAGALNAIPVAGPAILSGVEKAGAGLNNMLNGTPYDAALSTAQGRDAASMDAYPKTATAGGVMGTVAALAPAAAAAPGLFGTMEDAPLIANVLTGTVGGAGIGAADNMVRNGATLQNAKSGAFWGGLGGAGGPVVGKAVGATVGAVSNLLNRTNPAAGRYANMLMEAGMTPQDAQTAITRLGPDATPADVNALMAKHAGALAAQGGEPTATLNTAMTARAKGADGRVEQSIVQNLGPRPDLTATQSAIEDGASAAARPFYDAARANPVTMDATPIVSYIDGQLATAKGGVAKTLQMVRGLVTKQSPLPGVTVPEDNSQSLLGARQALDDFIKRGGDADTTAGQNALRQASNVRGQIDAMLKDPATGDPNIAQGDKIFSSKIVASSDLDNGNAIFKPSTRLEDFQRSVADASSDPDRLKAMQQGALAELHDKIGGQQGDYAAARNLLAKGTLNRMKLESLFPNAGDFFDSLEGEVAKRATENTVKGNSETASRVAIGRQYAPASGSSFDPTAALVGNAIDGGVGATALTGAKAVYGSLTNAFTEAARKRLNNGLARGLVSTGPEQQQFMDQVRRAYAARPVTQNLSSVGATGSNLLSRPPIQNGLRAKLEESPLPAQ